MDFISAVKAMEKGNKFTRGKTRELDNTSYYFIEEGELKYYYSGDNTSEVTSNRQLLDLMNDIDWEIFEEPKKTLSDKICYYGFNPKHSDYNNTVLQINDVKEFIKDLKNAIISHSEDVGWGNVIIDTRRIIDDLLGDKLV